MRPTTSSPHSPSSASASPGDLAAVVVVERWPKRTPDVDPVRVAAGGANPHRLRCGLKSVGIVTLRTWPCCARSWCSRSCSRGSRSLLRRVVGDVPAGEFLCHQTIRSRGRPRPSGAVAFTGASRCLDRTGCSRPGTARGPRSRAWVKVAWSAERVAVSVRPLCADHASGGRQIRYASGHSATSAASPCT